MDHVQTAPALTPTELALKLELVLSDPGAAEEQVVDRARRAFDRGIGVVTVRPSDLDVVARYSKGQTVLGALCSYPDGSSTTSVKIYEMRDLIRRGAKEISAVVNIGKLQSRQFEHVEMELIQLAQACHESGVKFRAIYRMPLLGEEQKLVVCKISKRSEVDLAVSGFSESVLADEEIMRRKCAPFVKICLFRTELDGALNALEGDIERIVVPDPVVLVEEFTSRLANTSKAT